MISKSYILENLRYCDIRFRRAKSTKENLFYSKLAIIEFCGWIEMSMDDVITRCAKRRIKLLGNAKTIEREIVGRNYGFQYDQNFRSMLMKLVGLIGVERIERQLDVGIHIRFVSTLGTLKKQRDSEAHTYIKGTTRNIDAPSVTIAKFSDIYAGITEIDKTLQRLGY